MNYLSHYAVDAIPQNIYFNTALFLPDITKAWLKKIKPLPTGYHYSPEHQQILDGCLQHYKSDVLFHSSPFFEHYQQLVSAVLKATPFTKEVNRIWFIAHILTELMIDRKIVQSNLALVDAFYTDMIAIDDTVLADFLQLHGMQQTDEFLKFFNHFRNVKYIYYYADNNKFIYSLSRIIMRVGMPELSEKDTLLLIDVVLKIEDVYMQNGIVLLQELRAVFNK